MPYIVTTKWPCRWTNPGDEASAECPLCEVSCRAVATLEEAHEAARELCLYAPGDVTAIAGHVREVFALPESGGTVGPLPDGTLIEVERVTHNRLAADADWTAPENDSDYSSAARHGAEVIAAYNARES